MPITSIAGFFGGKRAMAAKIVEQLGRPRLFCEPFMGGLSVIMRLEKCEHEIVNDLHGGVVCLARVVANATFAPLLYERLARTCFSEDLLAASVRRLRHNSVPESCPCNEASLDFAYDYFLATWMGRNGVAGLKRIDFNIAVRYTTGGGSATVRWANAIASIPAWHKRLLNVTILNRCGIGLLGKIDDRADTAIYCDPTYLRKTRAGTARYLHEMSEPSPSPAPDNLFCAAADAPAVKSDHEKIVEACHSFKKAKIVVSHYDCQWYRDAFAGWTVIDCPMPRTLARANRRGPVPDGQDAPELLFVN